MEQIIPPTIFIVLIGAFTLWLIGVVLRGMREQRVQKEIAQVLGPERAWVIDVGGKAFRAKFKPLRNLRNRVIPASLEITGDLPAGYTGVLYLYPETSAGGWLRAWGLTQKAATGDPELDRQCHIACSQPELVPEILASSDVRDAVLRLQAAKFKKTSFVSGQASTRVSPVNPATGQSLDDLAHAAAVDLERIASRVEAVGFGPRNERAKAMVWMHDFTTQWIGGAGMIALLVGSLFFVFIAAAVYPPLHVEKALVKFELAGLAVFGFALSVFRDRIRGLSLPVPALRLAGILSLGATLTWAFGSGLFLNALLATQPSQTRAVSVAHKYTHRNKGRTTYYVRTGTPLENGPGAGVVSDVKLKVSAQQYSLVVPGSTVVDLRYRVGFFGVAWREGFALR